MRNSCITTAGHSFASIITAFFFTNIHATDMPVHELYARRFLDLYTTIKKPSNGYFSAHGIPYHSVETMICEAPDYGHETTSEAFSYWLWLEGMFGFMSNQWDDVRNVWEKAERYIIPTHQDQPTNSFYTPDKPATFIPEYDLPSQYPAPLDQSVSPGTDPLFTELQAAYGTPDIYGMHWLLDVDNWYGFGVRGDGVGSPSYINTFERGAQESVWETVPHPSWENFAFGGTNGFLDLFVRDWSGYSRQWRYTNAPDADARMVQAMYWCYLWAKEKGQNAASVLPIEKASRMGDYLRYCLFDKYFRPISGAEGDYTNAHYLISWYYGWGGAIDPAKGWAYRIGCSHSHFGYQNPVAAYVLGHEPDFKPRSTNGQRDWAKSFERQFEFYQWLQSAEGAIGGGATSSWKGRYEAPPAGVSTFYGLVYDEAPVYQDPPSNSWFGWQAWSMQRMGEIYFLTGNTDVERIMDRWFAWVKSVVRLNDDGTYEIPSTIGWSGKPDSWNGFASLSGNPNYHVEVVDYTTDIGITASLARSLIHYSAARKKYRGTGDRDAMELARELIDRIYTLYADEKGFAAPEPRGDYARFFEQEVYVPAGFSGRMGNGDQIKPGIKFLDIRSKYRSDPAYEAIRSAWEKGEAPVMRYHRFWAQVELALAFAEYARFSQPNPNVAPLIVSADSIRQEISALRHRPASFPGRSLSTVSIHTGAGAFIVRAGASAARLTVATMSGRTVVSRTIAAGSTAVVARTCLRNGLYAYRIADDSGTYCGALTVVP